MALLTPIKILMLALLCLVSLSGTTHAGDFSVISVIRTLPLKSDEVVTKDYYINAGTNNGLSHGATIDALRKIPIYDNINSKIAADTTIPVARLKLIYVDKNMAIARMVQMLDRKTNPVPGFEDVIVGDLIRVSDKQ